MGRWKAPDNVNRVSVAHQQIEVGEVDHHDPRTGKTETVRGIDVPDALDGNIKGLGWNKLAMPRDLVKNDADELLTNGPTFDEWVKKGYAAEGYPPRGYASKHTPEQLAELLAAHSANNGGAGKTLTVEEQRELTAATAVQLKGMTSEQLLNWLKEKGVDVTQLPNRPLRLQAALDLIGFVEPAKQGE